MASSGLKARFPTIIRGADASKCGSATHQEALALLLDLIIGQQLSCRNGAIDATGNKPGEVILQGKRSRDSALQHISWSSIALI